MRELIPKIRTLIWSMQKPRLVARRGLSGRKRGRVDPYDKNISKEQDETLKIELENVETLKCSMTEKERRGQGRHTLINPLRMV